MAEVDWAKIKTEYISGNVSCRMLAEKYGISPNVVSKKATKDGWKNARRKCEEKTAEKLIAHSARAKADAALQGLDLCKYTMEIWNMNLKALNETIQQTPAYMLTNPSFASGIAKGLQTTYDLLMKMSGDGEKERRAEARMRKQELQLRKQKLAIEKQRLELEMRELQKIGAGGAIWEIVEDAEDGTDE